MFNRLQGQPESYERKAKYRFGRTLGAGTYGIVREADGPDGKVAIKIILKKNVKGNERMVWDELDMLQRLKHPHIVKFVDSFESKVGQETLDSCLFLPSTARLKLTVETLTRTNTILSQSLQLEESFLIGSASKESLPRRMRRKRSSKYLVLSTFFIATMSSTEVRP